MAAIDISSTSAPLNDGVLQLQNGVAMDSTLRNVADQSNTTSPLKLSTSAVQVASTLQITTNSNPYIDAEDGAGNNRFQVGRDPSSQVVNIDFASNPTGGTNQVGAIRTYTDGVNLAEVMSFRKDGNIGIDTTTISQKFQVGDGTKNLFSSINTLGGNLLIGSSGNTRFGFSGGGTSLVMASSGSSLPMSVGNFVNGALVLGVNNTEAMRISPSTYNVNINSTTDLAAKLGIKGSGSTSATTSLLVQNSNGNPIFQATDDRTFTTNGLVTRLSSQEVYCGSLALNSYSTLATGTGIYSTGNDGKVVIATSLKGCLISNWAGALINLLNSDNPRSVLQIASGFTDGNTNGLTGNTLYLTPQYNFTGVSLNNVVRGIYYNPTLTSLTSTTHYGIQTTSGGAYINTTTPQDSACLQADSTTQGFLPPRMTNAQRAAIATPAIGLMVYCTDAVEGLYVYKSTGWTFVI